MITPEEIKATLMMMVTKNTCLCRHLWAGPGPPGFRVLVQISHLGSAATPEMGAWQRVSPAHRLYDDDPVTSGSVRSQLKLPVTFTL